MGYESLELSAEAQQIAATKPRLWEHRLFFQVLKDEIAVARPLRQMVSPVPPAQVSLDTYGSWFEARIQHLTELFESLMALVNAEHDDAFGVPGQPGNVDEITLLSRGIASYYRRIIDWVHSVRDAKVDPRLQEIMYEMVAAFAEQPLRALECYGPNGLDSIETALRCPPGSPRQEILARLEFQGSNLTHFERAVRECFGAIENSEGETERLPFRDKRGRFVFLVADENEADRAGGERLQRRSFSEKAAFKLLSRAVPTSSEFKPRFLRDWDDDERAAADWMISWGFLDARLTRSGSDGGIDVESAEAVAQVKSQSVPVGNAAIQQLKGAAHDGRIPFFFSRSYYTRAAIAFADEAGVALFRFSDCNANVVPINQRAEQFLDDNQRRFDSDANTDSLLRCETLVELVATSFDKIINQRRGFGVFLVRETNRYTQFSLDANLCLESVGNKFLPQHEVLTRGEQSRLEAQGWTLGPDSNYRIDYSTPPLPLMQIVDVLTKTLIEVHGARTPKDIEVTIKLDEDHDD